MYPKSTVYQSLQLAPFIQSSHFIKTFIKFLPNLWQTYVTNKNLQNHQPSSEVLVFSWFIFAFFLSPKRKEVVLFILIPSALSLGRTICSADRCWCQNWNCKVKHLCATLTNYEGITSYCKKKIILETWFLKMQMILFRYKELDNRREVYPE